MEKAFERLVQTTRICEWLAVFGSDTAADKRAVYAVCGLSRQDSALFFGKQALFFDSNAHNQPLSH